MQNKTKKIIWGVLIVLLAAAGAFAYWWFFMRPSAEVAVSEPVTFPTGENIGIDEGSPELLGGQGNIGIEEGEAPLLRQLTKNPVAGAVIFSRAGSTLVRYAERGTGHLFEIGADDAEPKRISNQTIPEIGEVLWKPDGLGIIVRYAKESAGTEYIESFYASVPADATEDAPLRASFLPRNIRTLAFSPTGNTLFYLSENSSGSSGILAAPDGTRKNTLFELPLKDLAVIWSVNDSLFLTTRASSGAPGHLFSVGTQSGAVDVVASDTGLTALTSRGGTLALLASSGEGGSGLSLFNRSLGDITPLGLQTLADKCVWGKRTRTNAYCAVPSGIPGNNFPDSWYQGVIQTEDALWAIDAEDARASIVADISEVARESIDAFNFDISPDDKYLLFQNKNDLSLWLLKI